MHVGTGGCIAQCLRLSAPCIELDVDDLPASVRTFPSRASAENPAHPASNQGREGMRACECVIVFL